MQFFFSIHLLTYFNRLLFYKYAMCSLAHACFSNIPSPLCLVQMYSMCKCTFTVDAPQVVPVTPSFRLQYGGLEVQ